MPFFSIVIPTYNRAAFISETIESVINQTYSDWELIVIDDGSTDNTKEIIQAIIQNDNRIKYRYQNNSERSAARNNGINNSNGEYICFLDSDDQFLPNHLEILYEEIIKKKTPIALFFTNQLNSLNNILSKENTVALSSPALLYLFEYAIIPARICVHRNILKEEQFDIDITIVEDMILWVRISDKYPVFHIQKETVIYTLHEDNSININNTGAQKRLEGLLKFFHRYPQITNKISKRQQKKLLGDTLFNIAKYHIYHNHKYNAINYLVKSLLKTPKHPQTKYKINILMNLLIGNSKKALALLN
jgi:glycosyltransferase involved in cell wall biosynthesis